MDSEVSPSSHMEEPSENNADTSSQRTEETIENDNQQQTSRPQLPLVTCPYNEDHRISPLDFNEHVWNCRGEKMEFYPHAMVLKRCMYDPLHFLPEDEMPFHELFCKTQSEELEKMLKTEPIVLNVDDFLAAQKTMKAYDEADRGGGGDDDDSDTDSDEKDVSVTSEIADSELDEEDVRETVKRLVYLDMDREC
uniref:CHHC U11-48K-type domain-containing protein n=1 Tax=Caenorhabditis japonica TaxID=281687 RepID=A0A8R1HHV0_CAEJA